MTNLKGRGGGGDKERKTGKTQPDTTDPMSPQKFKKKNQKLPCHVIWLKGKIHPGVEARF